MIERALTDLIKKRDIPVTIQATSNGYLFWVAGVPERDGEPVETLSNPEIALISAAFQRAAQVEDVEVYCDRNYVEFVNPSDTVRRNRFELERERLNDENDNVVKLTAGR